MTELLTQFFSKAIILSYAISNLDLNNLAHFLRFQLQSQTNAASLEFSE